MRGRERIALGKRGEDAASVFLTNAGYRILARNYKTPFGEIDAVAKYKDTLVFIEIKTRSSSSLGPPFISVTWKKKKKIIQNALSYLKASNLAGAAWRIDVVSVREDYYSGEVSIEIIKNAVVEEG